MIQCLRFSVLLCLALLFGACGKRATISQEVAKIQATLPLSLGPAGSVTQMADEDSVVALTIMLNSEVMDMSALAVDRTALLEAFGRQFYSADARKLLQAMADEQVDFLVRYTDARQQATKSIRLRAEELKAVAAQRLSAGETTAIAPAVASLSPRASIMQSIVESDRKSLPHEVNPGLTLVAVDTTSAGVRYTTQVDTTQVNPHLLKARQPMLHDNILATIRNTKDATARQTYRLCGEYNVSLTFVYTFPQGKIITQVIISPKELLAATKNQQSTNS